MKILLVHQNFPGQYLNLARYMASSKDNIVVGLGESKHIDSIGAIPEITTVGYATPQPGNPATHSYLRNFENCVFRGQVAARAMQKLKEKGFVPDVICLHPGWGEGIFVKDIYPSVPVVMFCEYYFWGNEADLDFDPEFARSPDTRFFARVSNSAQLTSFTSADVCISPTRWQTSRYPKFMRERIKTIHDGINTDFMRPDPTASVRLQKLDYRGSSRFVPHDEDVAAQADIVTLDASSKVVTYSVRNLEPYRGFHIFLRSLPEVQAAHPDAHIIIIGGTEVSYSKPLPPGESYKNIILGQLEGQLDFSRIHFTGKVPYEALRRVFQISSAHVYLSYPFVLSWSLLEAMSCECLLIASRTEPLLEVAEDGKNAVLFDFLDHSALAGHINAALANPAAFKPMRQAARQMVVERYNLRKCLAEQWDLVKRAAAGEFKDNEAK